MATWFQKTGNIHSVRAFLNLPRYAESAGTAIDKAIQNARIQNEKNGFFGTVKIATRDFYYQNIYDSLNVNSIWNSSVNYLSSIYQSNESFFDNYINPILLNNFIQTSFGSVAGAITLLKDCFVHLPDLGASLYAGKIGFKDIKNKIYNQFQNSGYLMRDYVNGKQPEDPWNAGYNAAYTLGSSVLILDGAFSFGTGIAGGLNSVARLMAEDASSISSRWIIETNNKHNVPSIYELKFTNKSANSDTITIPSKKTSKSSEGVGKRKSGRKQIHTNAEIDVALKETHGNQAEAARLLSKRGQSITRSAISDRIKNAKEGSPLFEWKGKSKNKGGQIYTNAEIAAVLKETHGNQTKAAQLLSERGRFITRSAITKRIKNAKEGSPLFEWKDEFKKRGMKQIYSDAEIDVALKETHGNQTKAAQLLSERGRFISQTTVSSRIKNAKENSPLFEWKGKSKKGRRRTPSPKKITEIQ